MGTMSRADLRPPKLPEELVEVAEIGGAVRVRGLLLGDRLAMLADAKALENDVDHVALILSRTVFLDDGAPVFDFEAWRIEQVAHADATSLLFKVALRLNGADPEAAAKN